MLEGAENATLLLLFTSWALSFVGSTATDLGADDEPFELVGLNTDDESLCAATSVTKGSFGVRNSATAIRVVSPPALITLENAASKLGSIGDRVGISGTP